MKQDQGDALYSNSQLYYTFNENYNIISIVSSDGNNDH